MNFELGYSAMIMLDAEDLAEGGILQAYNQLLPGLRHYVAQPDAITEMLDDELPSYSVRHRDHVYSIYQPDIDEGESWGNATYALFSIVNAQLEGSSIRLYAINGGNDLLGAFLTPAQCQAARESLERKSDWPYLPTSEPPDFGYSMSRAIKSTASRRLSLHAKRGPRRRPGSRRRNNTPQLPRLARRRTQCRTNAYSGIAVGEVLVIATNPRRFSKRTAACTLDFERPVARVNSARLKATARCSWR